MQDMCPAQAEPAIVRNQYWVCGPDVCAGTGTDNCAGLGHVALVLNVLVSCTRKCHLSPQWLLFYTEAPETLMCNSAGRGGVSVQNWHLLLLGPGAQKRAEAWMLLCSRAKWRLSTPASTHSLSQGALVWGKAAKPCLEVEFLTPPHLCTLSDSSCLLVIISNGTHFEMYSVLK